MINNNHGNHMIVDSATPMFTSEFTINAVPNLAVGGGLEIPSLIHHHSMINEWNPMNALETGCVGIGQNSMHL
jgi:hypothetical protein